MILKHRKKSVFFISLLLLSGCFANSHYAPVEEIDQRVRPSSKNYIVSRGETLYSIAWRYGIDFRGLAYANNISAPYTIFPGQKLRLKTIPVGSLTSVSKAVPSPVNKSSVSKTVMPVKVSKVSPKPAPKKADTKGSKGYPFRWQWPAKGKIVRSYSHSSASHKGIDLQGKLGEPVAAANSGKVVYAGSGLVGYGNLLIIKHDEHYLSAYGHNSQLLVQEGDWVKVGQKIATFGDSGTDKVKLHFEIRRNGKPVNPLKVLSGAK